MKFLTTLKRLLKNPLKDRSKQLSCNQLSFVLPLALSGTGRPGSDLDRARILLDSCVNFIDPSDIAEFLIICPKKDMLQVQRGLAVYQAYFNLVFLDEINVCPILSLNPNTEHTFPRPNMGWYRQQLIKLAAHTLIKTPFYMTIDSDVIFKKKFCLNDIFTEGRAIVNVETYEDYRVLYTPNIADDSQKVRQYRYKDAERVLKLSRPSAYKEIWYGETPVVLSRNIVQYLVAHIEQVWKMPWQDALLQNLPWTEYPLYFLYAENSKALSKYHQHGGSDSISSLSQSLWLDSLSYLDERTLQTWPADRIFNSNSPGFTVVVQSYLGNDPSEIRNKIARFIEPGVARSGV